MQVLTIEQIISLANQFITHTRSCCFEDGSPNEEFCSCDKYKRKIYFANKILELQQNKERFTNIGKLVKE